MGVPIRYQCYSYLQSQLQNSHKDKNRGEKPRSTLAGLAPATFGLEYAAIAPQGLRTGVEVTLEGAGAGFICRWDTKKSECEA